MDCIVSTSLLTPAASLAKIFGSEQSAHAVTQSKLGLVAFIGVKLAVGRQASTHDPRCPLPSQALRATSCADGRSCNRQSAGSTRPRGSPTFAERISEPGKPSHVHADREILTFTDGRADFGRVGISHDGFW